MINGFWPRFWILVILIVILLLTTHYGVLRYLEVS